MSNSCSRLTGEGGDGRQSGGAGARRRGGIEHISQSIKDTNTHYITEYMYVSEVLDQLPAHNIGSPQWR